jgi:hypothetical protein
MCGVSMRDADVSPGSETPSYRTEKRRKLADLAWPAVALQPRRDGKSESEAIGEQARSRTGSWPIAYYRMTKRIALPNKLLKKKYGPLIAAYISGRGMFGLIAILVIVETR